MEPTNNNVVQLESIPQSVPQVVTNTTANDTVSNMATTEYAGFWRRLLASFIDGIILSVFGFFVGLIFGFIIAMMGFNSNSSVYMSLKAVVNIIIYAFSIYYYIYYIGKSGQTFGKKIMGIKVVNKDSNQPIGYVGAFLREIVGKFLSAFVLLIGFLWMLWDTKKQTWHDKISNSIVIKV